MSLSSVSVGAERAISRFAEVTPVSGKGPLEGGVSASQVLAVAVRQTESRDSEQGRESQSSGDQS